MDPIKRLINEALGEPSLGPVRADVQTREQLLHTISVYHEELNHQNDELKRINHDLERKHLEYESLFMEAPICYLLLDEELKIIKYNLAFRDLFKSHNILNKRITEYISEDSQDDLYFMMQKVKSTSETISGPMKMFVNDKQKHFKVFFNQLMADGVTTIRCSLIDITEERIHEEKIEYLSYHDQLTGLYNRRFFEEQLQRLNTLRNHPLGIVVADVNGLKLVNDAFGHSQGDQLLIETAKVLRNSCRQDEILARLGGDEFIIILPKTSELQTKNFMHRLKQLTDKIGVEDLTLSVAFGFGVKKDMEESINSLMKKAEDCMYNNKLMDHTSQRRKVIEGISATLHEKHPREEEHSRRVSGLAVQLGKALHLEDSVLVNLQTAGLLHDIGKIALDYRMIEKSSGLTEEEYAEVKKHSEIGYRILMTSGSFGDITGMVLSHHERMDGKGYPRQLKAGEIMLEARILCICDAFDAMTSNRPYRQALSVQEAVDELRRGSGQQFDGSLVKVFIEEVIGLMA